MREVTGAQLQLPRRRPEGARFCAGCSITLAHGCRRAASPIEAHHQYCAACGHRRAAVQAPAAAAGERRQVTVPFRDLVGYTELRSAAAALEATLGAPGPETLASA